ncbi:MAG: glutathione peroxidase [Pseudomonadota bacterium]
MSSALDFTCRALTGGDIDLDQYRGDVVLIVNTASKCGFTPQYAGLEALHQAYHERGLTILGFPCNQFGRQEPGSAGDIAQFCELNYGVSFPMFEKIDVNGANAAPLFTFLKSKAPGALGTQSVKWNFTKFLIDRDGQVVRRYAPSVKPDDLRKDIETLLNQGESS